LDWLTFDITSSTITFLAVKNKVIIFVAANACPVLEMISAGETDEYFRGSVNLLEAESEVSFSVFESGIYWNSVSCSET
jgi:hypothetical protein